KALILGTGSAQHDAIKRLKERGWWVIGCSYRHEGRGLDLLDQFELVDVKDHDGVEALGRREGVELLYSVGSDFAMLTVARVAPRLGLPTFVPYELAELMNNKIMLRDHLSATGISLVEYRGVRSSADLQGWNRFPAIVKPADSQGGRGVFGASTMDEIRAGLEESIRLSSSGSAIVEEYLDGAEISVNAFVLDGDPIFSEVSDRFVAPGSFRDILPPRGHGAPSAWCQGQDLCQTQTLVERAIKALGIENGPVYFQIKLTAKGPRILEATPRLDGCHIWRLLKMVYGVDLLDASFRWLDGRRSTIDLRVRANKGRHQLMFCLCPTGEIFSFADHEQPAGAFPRECYYQDGDTVLPVHGTMEKVAYYLQRG
ncbi:MAG: ATP-grasp domain-containing protein, partial [Anaerolineae bacterium]|nr:ATP-grasp domain-containing protein [Anaerolineae bacterium]